MENALKWITRAQQWTGFVAVCAAAAILIGLR
jgi:hypothetical protein